jgi:hypothetical protein
LVRRASSPATTAAARSRQVLAVAVAQKGPLCGGGRRHEGAAAFALKLPRPAFDIEIELRDPLLGLLPGCKSSEGEIRGDGF